MKYLFLVSGVVGMCLCSFSGQAQALIYQAKNPAFGGNTFNYQWMLSSAQVQDKTKDPEALSATRSALTSQTALGSFTESLNRQLLSRLSRQLVDDQFGEDGLKEGSYQFGDFFVNISRGLEGFIIQIADGQGGETTITVPFY
ncbi:curli assembly protein CsgF [Rhabdobacter roseus]|uniref:Curli production assembly/transport component CsgF n=1 Tax=Rhabdobacter roseus TaxID=1655419 RepID=A0A840TS54_9BACT|nr:curli production assembly/transport component CsgF [Rhabdobacter roseus]MBB5282539.1 curli production assembly/transport component CsgF [Rhabdobacter roseus]